jgi:ribosomal-protein-alanine N-acetyltransferase
MASFVHKGMRIEGKSIYLRALEESDATDEYASWLNDPEVTKYMDSSGGTRESIRDYIARKSASENSAFFSIFLTSSNRHIGNAKLEPIDLAKKAAVIGIMIGDRSQWGRGIGAEAISLVCAWAFEKLGLETVEAGVLPENIASIKAFQKAGFANQGLRKKPGPGGKIRDVAWLSRFRGR